MASDERDLACGVCNDLRLQRRLHGGGDDAGHDRSQPVDLHYGLPGAYDDDSVHDEPAAHQPADGGLRPDVRSEQRIRVSYLSWEFLAAYGFISNLALA